MEVVGSRGELQLPTLDNACELQFVIVPLLQVVWHPTHCINLHCLLHPCRYLNYVTSLTWARVWEHLSLRVFVFVMSWAIFVCCLLITRAEVLSWLLSNNTNVFLKLLLILSVCSVPPKTSSSVSIYLSGSSLYLFVHPLPGEFGVQQKPKG